MVTLDRQTPQKMSGKTVGEGEGKATLPPANILFEADMANMKYVDAQVGLRPNVTQLEGCKLHDLLKETIPPALAETCQTSSN